MSKNKLPKISVIVTTFNREATIEECLQSVIQQNYPKLELIIIDGKSTDKTIEKIKKYKKYISYFVSEKDNGPIDAYAKGVKASSGDLVNFLNSDDLYAPNTLNIVGESYNKIENNQEMITCGAAFRDLSSVRDLSFQYKKELLDHNLNNILFNTLFNGYFFKRQILVNEPFTMSFIDGTVYVTNDRDFLLSLVLKGFKNYVIDKPLYIYRFHEGSISFSGKNALKVIYEHFYIYKKYLPKIQTSADKKLLEKFYIQNINILFWHGIKTLNLKLITEAIKKGYNKRNFLWIYDLIKYLVTGFKYKISKFFK